MRTWFIVVLLTLSVCLAAGARDRDKDRNKNKGPSAAGTVHKVGGPQNPLGYNPVPQAEVVLQGTDKKTVTNEGGYFEFYDLEPGDYTILVTAAGYSPQQKSFRVTGGSMPAAISVPLLPQGTMLVDNTPVGPGTVYVAFAAKQIGQVNTTTGVMNQGFPLTTQDQFKGAIAAGADPLSLQGNPTLPPSTGPGFMEMNPINVNPNNLMILPPQNLNLTGYHTLSAQPYWLCFNAAGTRLYMSDQTQTIQVLDTVNKNTLLAALPAQGVVTDLRLSPDGNTLLASIMSGASGVMLIDTRTNTPTRYLTLPPMRMGGVGNPQGAVMSREGSRILVVQGNPQSGEVVALDAYSGQPLGSVPVGANPCGIAMSADGRFVYTANSASGDISVIDAYGLAELGRPRVGVSPMKIAVSPNGMRIFVTNRGSNNVTVLDGRTHAILATAPVGSSPIGVAVSPDSSRAFVACKDSGNVYILDGMTGGVMQTTVALPNSSPFGVAVKP
ncbi:MAG: carboxypeptidase-like regulatory domain-containing protein [Candidatus Eremiobacterota bacterium]